MSPRGARSKGCRCTEPALLEPGGDQRGDPHESPNAFAGCPMSEAHTDAGDAPPSLAEVVREWGRVGCIGFGGPPTHVALFRQLCVTRRNWLTSEQFERAIAATNLLPGPASTQLAIYCAWRLRGTRGALLGGLCFIAPGLLAI